MDVGEMDNLDECKFRLGTTRRTLRVLNKNIETRYIVEIDGLAKQTEHIDKYNEIFGLYEQDRGPKK